jgi:hypothetical protein
MKSGIYRGKSLLLWKTRQKWGMSTNNRKCFNLTEDYCSCQLNIFSQLWVMLVCIYFRKTYGNALPYLIY